MFNIGDEVESNLPQSYENEPSKHSKGPSIPKDNGEVLLTRTDLPETIIDVPVEEFVNQQLEVEYEEKFFIYFLVSFYYQAVGIKGIQLCSLKFLLVWSLSRVCRSERGTTLYHLLI